MQNRRKLTLAQKGLLLVVIPLLLESCVAIALWRGLDDMDVQTARLAHAKLVTEGLQQLAGSLVDMIKPAIAYAMLKSPKSKGIYLKQEQAIRSQLSNIESQTAPFAAEHECWVGAQRKMEDLLETCKDEVDVLSNSSLLLQTPDKAIFAISKKLAEATDEAAKLGMMEKDIELQGALAQVNARQSMIDCMVLGLSLNTAVALALAVLFYKQMLAKLQVLVLNTQRLAKNEDLLPASSEDDELGHLDKVFHSMADSLAAAAQYRQQMITLVGNDLRHPLNTIAEGVNRLIESTRQEPLPSKAIDQVSMAQRGTKRLVVLINDLLDIEKMEAGKLVLEVGATNSAVLCQKASEAVDGFARQHNISVKVDTPDCQLRGDADKIVQVLVNLLSNAIKFSGDRSLVTLSARSKEDCVEFRVTDQGPGIPPQYRQAIFGRFQQIPGTTSQKLKGTGLGLAISKAIVDAHAGKIGFETELDKGTTFWFTLPAAQQCGAAICQAEVQADRS